MKLWTVLAISGLLIIGVALAAEDKKPEAAAVKAAEPSPAAAASVASPAPVASAPSATSAEGKSLEEKKASQPAAESRYAVIEAIPGEEEDDDEDDEEAEESDPEARYAEDRDEEDEDEDQLALESHIEKDGHHHHEHAAASYVPAPQAYASAPQTYSAQPQQVIPVPLPVPVQPASVVLPTLPKQTYNPPARPVPPPPSPYSGSAPAVSYQPPPPPPPQPAYNTAQRQYQQPPPVAPQAYKPPPPPPQQQPIYQQSAPAPVYKQAPPPPPPQVYKQAPPPAYQPAPPPAPVYQSAPAPAYQPAPPPPPQPPTYQSAASQPVYQQAPPPQPPAYQPAPPPQPAYQQAPPPQPPAYQPAPPPAPAPAPYQQAPPPPQPAYQPAPPPPIPAPLPQVAPEATVALPAAAAPLEPWPAPVQDMPRIVSLDVKCEKNLMKVFIEFDKPFNGVIFSKGHFANVNCVHLPAGLGRTSANFDVSINSCGTTGNTENGLYGYGSQSGSGTFFENTIIIQYDPQVQEVWDQARKLRCTWHDQYEKSVTFRPFPVDMLDVVRADFAGDNVGCWMQIQVGKGPWASEVSGLVKIGQTMTMVLAIKDDDNKFDMLVRNCMAHDGKRAPIQLVDQKGCVTRPKLMSRFTKIKNFGSSASVLSYAHFQAFKFPDSMEVHFQCTIQICRYQCPDQCAGDAPAAVPGPGYVSQRIGTGAQPRKEDSGRIRRDVSEAERQDVGMNRIIQVVSTGDLTFALEQTKDNTTTIVFPSRSETEGLICMTSPGFAATLVVLLAILIISCLLSAFLCIRHRAFGVDRSLVSAFANPAFAHKKGHF